MNELRTKLDKARKAMAQRLSALGIEPEGAPVGGFTLWCRLPDGMDSGALARQCLDSGVVLAPGNAFSLNQNAASLARFNVAQTSEQALDVVASALRGAAFG